MVTQATSLSRNGVSDWIIQRVTAYILAAYTVVLTGYVLVQEPLTFEVWRGLFDATWMQIFTLLAAGSIGLHAWVGMWTIGTDYIREHYFGEGANRLRLIYEVVCIVMIASYLIWTIKILWGG
ncbi:MAG: succinate dehydrogenase, hydrophobic membrane anchor protein [Gammaproteobacteria bacterium]|nr:succinate dehydrogenase, hydrophobic membrane anchor protein [Gammaproteobacteria bacterium]OUU11525.1 MAG: succinate dehydrogenase, hydrophobic membrane anchor protein [Gammaproteobacteria bacterium TMED34]|tara:strand:- start:206 stop:574 length:369 start_codon:yes stop_codon:yes gene_type:complete